MYVGTTSGDVLQVSLSQHLFKNAGPSKTRIPKGVISNAIAPTGELVIGGGDGSVSVLDRSTMAGGSLRSNTRPTLNTCIHYEPKF